MMQITSAEFIRGSTRPGHWPESSLPEFAFIGRSNVGKSSLINMITGRKKLAKVSGMPGKTRQINHFLVNGEWFLADLPGYGFARLSKQERDAMDKMVRQYLTGRQNLRMTFLLIDSRHELQAVDTSFMKWMGSKGIPFTILFTKIDKLSRSQLLKNESDYKKEVAGIFPQFPEMILSSVVNKQGKDEILERIEKEIAIASPRRRKDTEII